MEPIELFRNIYFDRLGRYAAFCGAAIMRLEFRPTALTVFWVSYNFSMLVLAAYTFAVYDRITMWKLLSVIGLGVQGCVKFISCLYYAPIISRTVAFLGRIYASNPRPPGNFATLAAHPNYMILRKWSLNMWHLCRYGAVLIGSMVVLLVPLTLLSNWLLDERELPLPVYMPLIDERTNAGYALLLAYQAMMTLLGGAGLCATDLMLLMFVMHMWPMCDILRVQFEQMNAAVRVTELRDSRQLKWFLRNIWLMHMDTCNYIGDIARVYFFIIFTEIYTIAISLCALIFCSLSMTWYNIPFITALMLAKLLGFCLLGTIVELTTDHILMTMMNSDWYLLPVDLQRIFLRMLGMAQKPAILRAGTIPLNMDTFVNVIKTVYTVGMLLIETVE